MLTSTTIAACIGVRPGVQKADSEVAGQQIRHECGWVGGWVGWGGGGEGGGNKGMN
jgi:hypothetical protein